MILKKNLNDFDKVLAYIIHRMNTSLKVVLVTQVKL
jgi:hypothetical protein